MGERDIAANELAWGTLAKYEARHTYLAVEVAFLRSLHPCRRLAAGVSSEIES